MLQDFGADNHVKTPIPFQEIVQVPASITDIIVWILLDSGVHRRRMRINTEDPIPILTQETCQREPRAAPVIQDRRPLQTFTPLEIVDPSRKDLNPLDNAIGGLRKVTYRSFPFLRPAPWTFDKTPVLGSYR